MSWKFWKKDDLALPELGVGKDLGLDKGLDLSQHFEPQLGTPPPLPSTPSTFPSGFPQNFGTPSLNSPPPAFQQPEWEAPSTKDHVAKDLEIIAAKLDTIRAQLDMLNTRMANIEQQNRSEPGKRPWY